MDLKLLDEIELSLGNFILDNISYLNIYKIIQKRESLFERMTLKANFLRYNDFYNDIMTEICTKKRISSQKLLDKELENKTERIHKKILFYNNAISKYDSHLITISNYIRNNSNFEPIIITDDSDLTLHGQIISSLYGLSLPFLSIYEILKICNKNIHMKQYCKYKTIEENLEINIDDIITKEEIFNKIVPLINRSLISLHPKVRREENIKRHILI
jgi:hypothetical protein